MYIERPRAGKCQSFKEGELTNREFVNRHRNFTPPVVYISTQQEKNEKRI